MNKTIPHYLNDVDAMNIGRAIAEDLKEHAGEFSYMGLARRIHMIMQGNLPNPPEPKSKQSKTKQIIS